MIYSFVGEGRFKLESIKVYRTMSRDVKWHVQRNVGKYQKNQTVCINCLLSLPNSQPYTLHLHLSPVPIDFRVFIFSPNIRDKSPYLIIRKARVVSSTLWLSTIHFRHDFQPSTQHFLTWKPLIYRGLPPMKSDHLRTSPGMPSLRGSFSLMQRAKSSAVYYAC